MQQYAGMGTAVILYVISFCIIKFSHNYFTLSDNYAQPAIADALPHIVSSTAAYRIKRHIHSISYVYKTPNDSSAS